MRSPVVGVRADEHPSDRRRVRAELRQETERRPANGGTEGEGPRARRVRPRGQRLGLGSEVSPADVHVLVQSHGIWKLHGLLPGKRLSERIT